MQLVDYSRLNGPIAINAIIAKVVIALCLLKNSGLHSIKLFSAFLVLLLAFSKRKTKLWVENPAAMAHIL